MNQVEKGITLFIIGTLAVLLIITIYVTFNDYEILRKGVDANGIVVKVSEFPQGDGGGVVYHELKCLYNDSIYFPRITTGEVQFKTGDSLSFKFIPGSLKNQAIVSFRDMYVGLVVSCILLIVFIIGILFFIKPVYFYRTFDKIYSPIKSPQNT